MRGIAGSLIYGILFVGALFAQTRAAAEQTAALEGVKAYARSYTESLPDYVAKQTIQRDVSPVRRGLFLPTVRAQRDVVEEEIRFAGRRELHRTTRVNGQAVDYTDPVEQGTFSQGEFGAMLSTVFDPASGTQFRWNREATVDNRRVFVFDFQVPERPAGYGIMEADGITVVAFRGTVYADKESKAVVRIQMNCTGIPSSSAYQRLGLIVQYSPVEIAGRKFMLPARYTLNATRGDATLTLDGRYTDYRRFAADSKLVDIDQP